MDDKFSQINNKILLSTQRLSELSSKCDIYQSYDDPTKQALSDSTSRYIGFVKIMSCINQSNCTELKISLYEYAIRYSRLRIDQLFASDEQKKILEEERKRAHNAFIDACNIMSRNMIKKGEDVSWRKELGDDRKVIGDFACYINYALGLKAR